MQVRKKRKLKYDMAELLYTSLFTDPNLQVYWRFEDNGNDSYGSINPTASIAPTYANGKYTKSATFAQSSGHYLGYDNVLNIASGDESIVFWYKNSSAVGANGLICGRREAAGAPDKQQNIIQLHDTGNGGFKFYYRFGNAEGVDKMEEYVITSSFNIYDNKWHHFAFTITLGTGSSAKGYIDGTLISGTWQSGSGSNLPINDSTQKFTIGGTYTLGGYLGALNGTLDELAIFTKILSTAEIQTLATEGNFLPFL